MAMWTNWYWNDLEDAFNGNQNKLLQNKNYLNEIK